MRRVLIAGAAGGIGAATASEFSGADYEVVAADIDLERLSAVPAVERLHLDITLPESVAGLVEAAGPFDVLVNTIGQGAWSPVALVPFHVMTRLYTVNTIGPIALMQAAVAHMSARKVNGTVINVSSAGAHGLHPLFGLYAGTKAALDRATHAMRVEASGLGISIAVIEPTVVATEFASRRFYGESRDPYYSSIIEEGQKSMSARSDTLVIQPEDVARVIRHVAETDDPGYRWAVRGSAAHAIAAGPVDDDVTRAAEAAVALTLGLKSSVAFDT